MANIVITGVTINPNPVSVGAKYVISVDIKDKEYVLDTGNEKALVNADGALLKIK